MSWISKHFFYIVLAIIFLAGFCMRVVKWQHFDSFAGDEGIQLLTASHIFRYGEFPLSGEISALDRENKFIIHNSPLSLYFLTLIYLLGFATPEGYTLVYLLLNMIQVGVLFLAAKDLFNKRAALLVAVVALFSGPMINYSVWTSQPTNALFFETLAIFFFVKYLKTSRTLLFLLSFASALLAIQMYPPMYILLPFKIGIFIYSLANHFTSKTERITILLKATGIAVLIYLPLLLLEFSYQFINLSAVREFITTKDAQESSNFLAKDLILNLRSLENTVKWNSGFFSLTSQLFWVSISTGIAYYIYRHKKKENNKLYYLLLSILIPLFLLSLWFDQNLFFDRAYLFGLIPYYFLLIGLIFSELPKVLFGGLLILIIFYQVFFDHVSSYYLFLYPTRNVTLHDIRETNKTILNDLSKRNEKIENAALFTISEGEKWSWDSTIYWYIMEQLTNSRLARIQFYTSKAYNIHQDKPLLTYYICHGHTKRFTKDDCQTTIREQVSYTNTPELPIEEISSTAKTTLFVVVWE